MASKNGGWRSWWSDAAKNAAGNAIWAIIVLALGGLLSRLPPIKAWLLSEFVASGWAWICIIVASGLFGYGIARTVHARPKAPIAVVPTTLPQPQPVFEPTEFQCEIIRVLRWHDGDWVSAEKLSKWNKNGSIQDVELALEELIHRGWAADLLTSPRRYRLAGKGVEFARTQEYLTQTQAEQKRDAEEAK